MGGEPAPPPVDERERQAAHAACVAWLKQPGGKSATPYGHFLRGWYAHQEWLEKASAERIAELERCLRYCCQEINELAPSPLYLSWSIPMARRALGELLDGGPTQLDDEGERRAHGVRGDGAD
jgi:hypothetical protein